MHLESGAAVIKSDWIASLRSLRLRSELKSYKAYKESCLGKFHNLYYIFSNHFTNGEVKIVTDENSFCNTPV